MMGGYIAAQLAQVVAQHGETMVLSRQGEGTTITLKGKRFANGLDEMQNSAVQQVFKVKIAPTEIGRSAWAVKAPKRGDKILVDGRSRTVRDAVPLKDGDTVALYELEVAG